MCNLSWTPHSNLANDNSLNHSCVSPKMGCLQRRSQDFCLGGGPPGRCHPVHFPSSPEAGQIQSGGGVGSRNFPSSPEAGQIQSGGGVVAESCRDLQKSIKLPQLRAFFLHLRATWRSPTISFFNNINSLQKNPFNKSLGGAWPPWPPWLRHWLFGVY